MFTKIKKNIQLPTNPSIDATRTNHKGRHNSAYDRMILNRLGAIKSLNASDHIKNAFGRYDGEYW